MRLLKMTEKPAYAAWAALAAHCVSSRGAVATETQVAPSVGTGGGRGFGVSRISSEDGGLRVAEALLAKALDKQPAAERDSETLGLFVHTLVRQGRPLDALAAIAVGGQYWLDVAAADPQAAIVDPNLAHEVLRR